ncbi:transposable element Tc3 transposase [Trichonephila clavipes]|nr:transposable element Tc3 transposase [Trichonephila clavipes]
MKAGSALVLIMTCIGQKAPEASVNKVSAELWFQQDGATCHTARATDDLLKDTFGDRLISRFGPLNWLPRSCDLTPLDCFLWGYVKSLVYVDKLQTLDYLEDNVRRVIADIRPQMSEKVIENWTSRLDYIRASRGSPMPEIIFKMIDVSLRLGKQLPWRAKKWPMHLAFSFCHSPYPLILARVKLPWRDDDELAMIDELQSLVYADKPQTLDHLEDNIRRVIADIRPQMLEKSSKIGRPDWTTSEPAVAVLCQKSYLKCAEKYYKSDAKANSLANACGSADTHYRPAVARRDEEILLAVMMRMNQMMKSITHSKYDSSTEIESALEERDKAERENKRFICRDTQKQLGRTTGILGTLLKKVLLSQKAPFRLLLFMYQIASGNAVLLFLPSPEFSRACRDFKSKYISTLEVCRHNTSILYELELLLCSKEHIVFSWIFLAGGQNFPGNLKQWEHYGYSQKEDGSVLLIVDDVAKQVEKDRSQAIGCTNVWRIATSIDQPRSTVHYILREVLRYYPYKLSLVQHIWVDTCTR